MADSCINDDKFSSCLSLLARSVPPCGPEVDDANGLYFVRELIANMDHDSETGCTGMRLAVKTIPCSRPRRSLNA
jgi:hypothetical protein